jgi:hypothetical protein
MVARRLAPWRLLQILRLLRDGPQACIASAASTGSDAPSLFRLMRARFKRREALRIESGQVALVVES